MHRSLWAGVPGGILLRRLNSFVLAALTVLSAGSIVGQAQSLLTHHVRAVTVNGQARSLGRLPETQTMRIAIVLPLRNQADLDNFLEDVYNPANPSYRHFLSVDEFTARFGPTQGDYDAVINFAQTHGLTVVGTSRNRLNVEVTGTVASIEKRLPSDDARLSASHGKPYLLCSGSRAHRRSSVPTVAYRGTGQLFDSASGGSIQKQEY